MALTSASLAQWWAGLDANAYETLRALLNAAADDRTP